MDQHNGFDVQYTNESTVFLKVVFRCINNKYFGSFERFSSKKCLKIPLKALKNLFQKIPENATLEVFEVLKDLIHKIPNLEVLEYFVQKIPENATLEV